MKFFDAALEELNKELGGRTFTYKSKYGGQYDATIEYVYCIYNVRLSGGVFKTSPQIQIKSSNNLHYKISEIEIHIEKGELSKLETYIIETSPYKLKDH